MEVKLCDRCEKKMMNKEEITYLVKVYENRRNDPVSKMDFCGGCADAFRRWKDTEPMSRIAHIKKNLNLGKRWG